MGMGVAHTAFEKISRLGHFFRVSCVHYQPIPGEKPFEFNCSGIFARLTAHYSYFEKKKKTLFLFFSPLALSPNSLTPALS